MQSVSANEILFLNFIMTSFLNLEKFDLQATSSPPREEQFKQKLGIGFVKSAQTKGERASLFSS